MRKRVLSYFRYQLFEKNADKFRPGSLKRFMDYFFILFEKAGYNFDFIVNNYMTTYREIVNEELKLAEISSKDHVLVIGCGSIPATALVIADEKGANCVAIDSDAKAINSAIKCVNSTGFQNKISIELGDGARYKIEGFSVIFILYGVKNHKSVLKYLSERISDNVRVIFRVIDDPESDFPDEEYLSKMFIVNGSVKTKVFGPMCSYLLVKK